MKKLSIDNDDEGKPGKEKEETLCKLQLHDS